MSSRHGPAYFPNASNAVINNPTITHVSGNAYFSSSERHGMRLLLDNISQGAFHDAAERGDPPKCHPRTRLAIREEIMEWVKAPEARRKLIIWMYGPAGSGKTAIAQSIAEECSEQGLLAASFFFSRTAPGRNDTTRLAATLSYQLSRSIPEIREHVIAAIEEDPAIFFRSLSAQMQVLAVNPLKALPPTLKPIFVILDGIDECGPSPQTQAQLLDILGTVVSELQHIQLIFLIASRPEYEIRESFSGNLLNSLARSLVLDDSYKPDEDIKLYFNSSFEAIHAKHCRLGTRLPSSWPSESTISSLVSKASGQFIFAATVIKFVDTLRNHPAERLDIILGLVPPGHETPFALLDALYRYILSSAADLPKVLEILTLIILPYGLSYFEEFTDQVKMIEDLLDVDVHRTLLDMHALIFVPTPTDKKCSLGIHHASLHDFLTDRSRSHDLYVDTNHGHVTLSRRWFKMITDFESYTYRHLFGLPGILSSFVDHCFKSPIDNGIAEDLGRLNLRQHLEAIRPDKLYVINWGRFFECAQRQGGEMAGIFPRLQDEFDTFVLERISKYPPVIQQYIPTILATNPHGLSWHTDDDIFHILLHGVSQSDAEIHQIRRLDSVLLDLRYYAHRGNLIFSTLFRDRSRAGHFCVNSASYAMLARQIVRVVFPKPGEDIRQAIFKKLSSQKIELSHSRYSNAAQHTTTLHYDTWFANILAGRASTDWNEGLHYATWFVNILVGCASTDKDLAVFLSERALQYRYDAPDPDRSERYTIARACLIYIMRCGIPYLKHTHPPDTDKCIICEECNDAYVVDSNLPDSPWLVLPPSWDFPPMLAGRIYGTIFPLEISTVGVSQSPHISYDTAMSSTLPPAIEALPVAEHPTKSKRKRAESSPGEHDGSTHFKVKRTAS